MAVSQLQKIFDARNVKHQTVADYLGVSRQSVTQWVKLGAPSRRYLDKLATYLDVEPLQLTGDLPFLTEDEVNAARQKTVAHTGWMILSAPEDDGAPKGIVASCEFPAAFLSHIAGRDEIAPEDFLIISAQGDAMEPTIQREGCCIVDKRQNELAGEGLYALRLNETVVISRVQPQFDGFVLLLSDNPKYPPQRVTAEQIGDGAIVGRVVYVLNGRQF